MPTALARSAAVVSAALLLATLLGLTGAPGAQPVAHAAAGPTPGLSSGLATVQTIQGVFVPDGPTQGTALVVSRVVFAVASNGDRAFDIRFRPDYAAAQKLWRASAKLRTQADTGDVFYDQIGAPVTRQVVVVDGATGLQQSKTWIVNPFTRRVVGVRYRYYKGWVAPYVLAVADGRSFQFLWTLSTVLDIAPAAGRPHVAVTTVDHAGRPSYLVTVNADGRPSYTALIDARYGLTDRVTSLQGSRSLEPYHLIPFHLEDVRVNQPIAPGVFVMRPDYRYSPAGYGRPKPTDTPARYGMDLGERPIPLAALAGSTSSWTLLPRWLPPGYRLAQVERDGDYLRLFYRSGMDEIIVGTAGKHGSWITDGSVSQGMVFESQPTYPEPGGWGWPAIGDQVSTLREGAMAGWPAGSGPSDLPGRNFVGTVAFGVSGTAPIGVLRRVAESMRQARPGPHLPGSHFEWAAWLAAIVGVVGLALAQRRRRATADGAPSPGRARVLLVGVALVSAGLLLSWHQLYGGRDHFTVAGWREPLALVTFAAALLAAAAAIWTPAPRRAREAMRFATLALGLATLAAVLLALVYLPVKARFFTTTDPTDLRWTSIHDVLTYFRGVTCPAPGPGLYLSLAGAVLVAAGAVATTRGRAAKRAEEASAGEVASPPAVEGFASGV